MTSEVKEVNMEDKMEVKMEVKIEVKMEVKIEVKNRKIIFNLPYSNIWDLLVVLSLSNHNYWPFRSLEVKNGGQSAKIDFPRFYKTSWKFVFISLLCQIQLFT